LDPPIPPVLLTGGGVAAVAGGGRPWQTWSQCAIMKNANTQYVNLKPHFNVFDHLLFVCKCICQINVCKPAAFYLDRLCRIALPLPLEYNSSFFFFSSSLQGNYVIWLAACSCYRRCSRQSQPASFACSFVRSFVRSLACSRLAGEERAANAWIIIKGLHS
jgi:hypothetical protein